MPMTATTGLSAEGRHTNYGSASARACNITFEADHDLLTRSGGLSTASENASASLPPGPAGHRRRIAPASSNGTSPPRPPTAPAATERCSAAHRPMARNGNHGNGNRPTATAAATATAAGHAASEKQIGLCPATRQGDPGPRHPPPGNPGPEDVRQAAGRADHAWTPRA